jgi:hypothetical protein
MKWLSRILLWVAGALSALVLLVVAQETWIYVARTEASALEMARWAFLDACERHGLDQSKFGGPRRIKSDGTSYNFLWKDPANGDQILALVAYFPYRAESWWTSGKENARFQTYCDKKDPTDEKDPACD